MIKLQSIEMLLAIQDCDSIRAAAKSLCRGPDIRQRLADGRAVSHGVGSNFANRCRGSP